MAKTFDVPETVLNDLKKKYLKANLSLPSYLEESPDWDDEFVVERSLVLIKPDAFDRGLVGEILDLLANRQFRLIACKEIWMTPDQCKLHYAHHVGKPFWSELQSFMTSGPSLACVYEGKNVCYNLKKLIGSSKHPSQSPAGSIRGRYASEFPRNLIHGSDHAEDAAREISLYFCKEEIYDDQRINEIYELRLEKERERLRLKEELMKKGIKVGDPIVSPFLLRAGDIFIDYTTGGYEAYEIYEIAYGKDYVDLIFAGIIPNEMPRKLKARIHDIAMAHPVTGKYPTLVKRDGDWLKGYQFPDILNEKFQSIHFNMKNQEWQPKFQKKKNLNNDDIIGVWKMFNPYGLEISKSHLSGPYLSVSDAIQCLVNTATIYKNEVVANGAPFKLTLNDTLFEINYGGVKL